jgi:hypothetical protein
MTGERAAGARLGRRATGIAIVLVLWGLITHGTFAGTGDEPHYVMIVHSIVFDGDLDLSNNYADPPALVFGGRLDPGTHVSPDRDGRLRPVHDLGMPLLFAPYYAVAYPLAEWIAAHAPPSLLARARLSGTTILRHLLSLGMIVVTMLIGLRLYDAFLGMSGAPRRAAIWALLFTLSPPLLSHSFLFFSEITSAWLVIVIWTRLHDRRPTTWDAALVGTLTGFLLLVHVRNIGLVAALLVLGFRRYWRAKPRTRPVVAFVATALVLFGLRTFVNYEFWGTWFSTPHARAGGAAGFYGTIVEIATRFAGWAFDQKHGLLLYAPLYVLTLPGLVLLWKRSRGSSAEVLFVLAACLGPIAIPLLNPHGWRGAWAPAARFLVPIVPLLAVVAFSAVVRIGRLPLSVRILVALQLLLDVLFWQRPKLLWNGGEIGPSRFLEFAGGAGGWLSAWAPAIDPPLSTVTIVGVVCASVGWLVWTVWIVRRSRTEQAVSLPQESEADI